QEADGDPAAEQQPQTDEHDDANHGDRGVLTLEIGLRALSDSAGDFLHARRTCIGRHHGLDGPDAVDDGERTAGDNGPKSSHESSSSFRLCGRENAPAGTGASRMAALRALHPDRESARTMPKTLPQRNAPTRLILRDFQQGSDRSGTSG